jgi:hypothetical protein
MNENLAPNDTINSALAFVSLAPIVSDIEVTASITNLTKENKNMSTSARKTVKKADRLLAESVEAIQQAFDAIREQVPTLPRVVVTVQRQAVDGRQKHTAHGWTTTVPVWTNTESDESYLEVVLTAESLSRGPIPTLGTLLHESAHVLNLTEGVRGCDSNGRHNKRFKATAEEVFGLEISENHAGWSETVCPDSTAKKFAKALTFASKATRLVALATARPTSGTVTGTGALGGLPTTTGKASKRNRNNPLAQCGCGNKIRVSNQVLAIGLTCKGCGEDYSIKS